ncbi:MAG: ATP-binding protein [Polyangia bacterium]
MTPRILLVDDNPAQVDNMREVLEDAGHGVRAAGSIEEARRLAESGYDVALVDLRLPDGEGLALAAELRERVPDGLVILLTGFATIESAAAAVRAGAWDYLVKPVAMRDLLFNVEQALRQVRLLTERRELARRAQVAEKLAAVGTLTAGLSHEIRNPLNAATLQLAVLRRRVMKLAEPERDSLLQPLQLVHDEIGRLGHLLDDFLAFARPHEGARERVALGVLVGDVVRLVQPAAEEKNVRLLVRGDENVSVDGDRKQLKQIVLNLILNAIEAVPASGLVRVTLSRGEDQVSVVVDDDGPGVSNELLDRVVEPFFTTKDAGSGLGLPIVYKFVQQHAGRVSIERGDLGGARVSVQLPSSAATT